MEGVINDLEAETKATLNITAETLRIQERFNVRDYSVVERLKIIKRVMNALLKEVIYEGDDSVLFNKRMSEINKEARLAFNQGRMADYRFFMSLADAQYSAYWGTER